MKKKLGGILAETVETSLGRAVVVGIGINLTSKSFAPDLDGVASSVEAATGKRPDSGVVNEALVRFLMTHYQLLQQPGGREVIVREWCARSSYATGKRISVVEGSDRFVGTTRGLESDGALRVETDEGKVRIVRAGDVSVVRSA